MMLDEPIRWDDQADKEALLDYVFEHQRMTKANDAVLAQYGTTREQFIGLTPYDLFKHDLAHGRSVWKDFFDRGRLHVKTHERRIDGTPIDIEGDYICLYDEAGRIIGHFGIQRDVTEQVRLQQEVEQHAAQLEVRVKERTAELARSESRVRAIVNALPDLLFVIDSDGRYLEIVTDDPPAALPRRVRDDRPAFPRRAAVGARRRPLLGVRRTVTTGTVQMVEYPLDVQAGTRWFEGRTATVRMEPDCVPNVVVHRARHHRPEARRRSRAPEHLSPRGPRHGPPVRRDPRPLAGDAAGVPGHRAGGRHRLAGAHPRRDRHRQGAHRPCDSPHQPPAVRCDGQGQLRGAAGHARRERALRARARRLHRRRATEEGPVRAGAQGDDPAGRGRRPAARGAGEAAPRAAGARVRARRGDADGQGGRARDCGHQPRAGRGRAPRGRSGRTCSSA